MIWPPAPGHYFLYDPQTICFLIPSPAHMIRLLPRWWYADENPLGDVVNGGDDGDEDDDDALGYNVIKDRDGSSEMRFFIRRERTLQLIIRKEEKN